jgi:CBS domain-containing protein
MNPDVITGTKDQNIMNACKIMRDNNIGCIIIIELGNRDKPIGIITERDVVNTLAGLNPTSIRVALSELMTKPLITINENSSVKDAMELMNNKDIRRLVVVNADQQMIGITTLKDIFKLINSSTELFTEFYQTKFPDQFKNMYQRFSEYKFNGLSPYV